MRALIALIVVVFTVAACSSYEEDYRYRNERSYPGNNGYHTSGGGYSGGDTYIYETNNYSTYYPFGNVYYPRDRIWIIQSYGGCNYYSYRGYCYRYRDDFDRVIIWDRQHGYNDDWYRKRQDWCRRHDCHHDDIVRDGKGRPVKPQHVERDRMQRVPQAQPRPQPRTSYPVYKTDNNRSRGDRYDNNDDNSTHRDRSSGRSSSSDDRQPVLRNTSGGGIRDVEQQPQSAPSQPVIQHSRPVFVPRNSNSGWAGSAAGSDNDSSGRYDRAPRASDSQNTAPVRVGTGRSQDNGNSGGSGRQRQMRQGSGAAPGGEQ